MAYVDTINRNSVNYPLVALSNIVTISNSIDTQIKTGTLKGFTFTNISQSFKIYLINGNNISDIKLNINNLGAKDIKIYKSGELIPISYNIDSGTILEVFFNGTDFIVIGNPVIKTTSDYTIYADGTIAHKEFFYKKGKEVTVAELENYFHLNREFKGYHIICTCFEQGYDTYIETMLINSELINLHTQYISISYSENKLIASTSLPELVNLVCWTIYPIGVVTI